MGIFHRTDQSRRNTDTTTIIAPGSLIVGDIKSQGGVHVDGVVEGDIEARTYVIVTEKGKVQGSIHAREVYLSGVVYGDIWAIEVDLLDSGHCEGKIEAIKVSQS